MSRDTWEGDGNQPITLNKWTYGNSNPIIYIDPTGYLAYVKYDRNAAAQYALRYAVNGNPEYRRFDADCTSFVSQALHAGGVQKDSIWYYDRRGRTAWAETDKFFGYFVGYKHYSFNIITGTLPPTKLQDLPKWDRTAPKMAERLGASTKNDNVIPNPLQGKKYGSFNFSRYNVRRGDVVLYSQLHSGHVQAGGGTFNHAAFVVFEDGALTDRYHKTVDYSRRVPWIAEHSGGYESEWGGRSTINNIHSINDTWSEVQFMLIIHVPEWILVDDGC